MLLYKINLKMDKPSLKAAILIVSTTAAKDASTDSSGPILKSVFEETDQWVVVETKIVSDNVTDIQRSVMSWTDHENAVNVVITTGGTGFAVSDSTPEVIRCTHSIVRIAKMHY